MAINICGIHYTVSTVGMYCVTSEDVIPLQAFRSHTLQSRFSRYTMIDRNHIESNTRSTCSN